MARWVALSFLLGSLATHFHLAIEAHDRHPEHEDHDPHDSDHSSHPSADHEVVAIRAGVPLLHFGSDPVAIGLDRPAPDVQVCIRTVEAEANGPPAAPESPPRSARAPPL